MQRLCCWFFSKTVPLAFLLHGPISGSGSREYITGLRKMLALAAIQILLPRVPRGPPPREASGYN